MAVAMGGDETGALVGDVGSFSSKFGFAGEDAPKCVMHSQLGVEGGDGPFGGADEEKTLADLASAKSYELGPTYPEDVAPTPEISAKRFCSPLAEGCWGRQARVVGPLKDGKLTNWDVVEALWETAEHRLRSDIKAHPVMCGMPSWTPLEDQERYLELLFERFEAPAAFLSRHASLVAFSSGRASALVVECGAGSTSVCPVVDGYALLKAAKRSPVAGDFLDQRVLSLVDATPRCEARAAKLGKPPPAIPTLRSLAQLEVAREIKENLRLDGKRFESLELPDGTKVDTDLSHIPQLLFADDDDDDTTAKGLPSLVKLALLDADVDVRKDLLQSVVLSGGGSLFPGLPDKLHHDLNASLASNFKARLIVPTPFERAFAVWIGGSILASLGSFQQQWLSRAEYFDDGPLANQERWN